MPHRTIRGRLAYTSNKPERLGQERGRESFTITVHGDGRRTLRAQSEIDDPPAVLRDVTLSVGPDGRPVDAFVRLSVGDRYMGSSWFRFTDRAVECEGHTEQEGRISQRIEVPERPRLFGTHPIVADAWITRAAALDRGAEPQQIHDLFMCSLDHRGATGPMLLRSPTGVCLTFLGREKLTVQAGTFDALHFRIGDSAEDPKDTRNAPGSHPRYELWCTDDGDYVFLKAWVSGYMMTAYELVELERS
jgi:hypothetical protein